MKIKLIQLFMLAFIANIFGQNVGDTITIKTLKYGSTTRDTMISFPNGPQTFEKIIMKYNMRCKNALISTQAAPNQGCGEWDYSCNTYIVDSSKIEKDLKKHPSHLISNFTGTAFPYAIDQPFDYYDYKQTNVNINSIISETLFPVGNGFVPSGNILKSDEHSGHSQILVKASELTAAGLTAGPIHGFFLNVANAGGLVQFFKVKMQLTSATNTALSASSPTLTGFTEVYNKNMNFINGNNRVQFHTPFNWDGTSNVIIDLSFTNTQPSAPILFNGLVYTSNVVLYTNNNYAAELSNFGHAVINTASLNTIGNEVTISLWAYGNAALLPANTSVLWAWSNDPNQRQINIHFPWSNGSVYFDAGFTSGGFDRIDKAATTNETEGQWNHWAFTKNATSGDMKIYVNGALWHSGVSKTKVMSILNMILGKDNNLNSNYKGKVNELTIWNKELGLVDIQSWMNRTIDNTHPFYNNLVAYYQLNEGTGQLINDSKFSLTSNGTNLQWTYDRGDKLTRNFIESTTRPNIEFFRGNYSLTTSTVTVRDSVGHLPKVVQAYSITSQATVTPMAHDLVVLSATSNSYHATTRYIYDGDLNVLTGTLSTTPTGTFIITDLNYYERYPFYNEIMSFVTPYGKGLDLGAKGKTWYFDVTDFAPILKGQKRFVMSLGGQWQEQMDIDFYFIVGTPPRTVLQFNQIWQGGHRIGGPSIGTILNDSRFEPTAVPTLSNGAYFKMRSTITGHGSEGEFQQNGGQVTHSVNINGGASEFAWVISSPCGAIPVYPQGGTWLYDRQGWCPGDPSLLKQFNATPFITPGNTVTIDYHCSNPPVASGDYRYIAAHQLITYGGANHNLDASILEVLQPSNKVAYSRQNPMCAMPKILVQNTGSTSVTSIEIDYWLNNSTTPQTYTWTGTLAFMDTVTIKMPIGTLWQSALQPTNNVFHAEIKKVNNSVDDYVHNNKYHSPFTPSDQIPDNFIIEVKTNNYYTHNAYKLYDDLGNIVGTSSFTAANTVFPTSYQLTGCYRLVVTDVGKDGLYWWANTAQGNGYIRIKNAAGATLKSLQPDFGSYIEYSFSTFPTTTLAEQNANMSVSVYPNPAHDKLTLSGVGIENADVTITSVLGSVMATYKTGNENVFKYDSSRLTPGVYFVTITKGKSSVNKKIIIN